MQSEEEKRAYHKAYNAKYFASEKGKATREKYYASEAGKASNAKYYASEKCKASKAKYNTSEERKASQSKYNTSEAGKASNKKYQFSEKGKAVKKKYDSSNKLKCQAKSFYNKQVKLGNIIPETQCGVCGKEERIEFHHFSYEEKNWLVGIYLCNLCHRATHRVLRALSNPHPSGDI